jgi:uncharacterized Zn-binding protein involved in type VI secretion
MRRFLARPILLALLVSACAADAPADLLSPQLAKVATPFQGSCELVIQPSEPISPGVVRQIDIGDCRISHLGRATFISDKVIDFVAGTQSIQGTYIAANGDLLYANGSGTSQFIAPGRVAFQGNVTFEGGTGRFANASGTATMTGEADPVNARSSFTTTGTIMY